MPGLMKGQKVSMLGAIAGSFRVRKKKELAMRPVLPWRNHQVLWAENFDIANSLYHSGENDYEYQVQ